MKKKNFASLLLSAIAMLSLTCMVSCKEETVEEPDAILLVTTQSINFEYIGDTQLVTIRSNSNWTAKASESWVTTTPNSGYGNTDIKLIVSDNNSEEDRNCVVTIALQDGSSPYEIKITQAGKELDIPTVTEMTIKTMLGLESGSVINNLNDCYLNAIVCNDPTNTNCAANTLFLMVEGAKGAGQAVAYYDGVTDFSTSGITMGDEVKVSIPVGVTINMDQPTPQIEAKGSEATVEKTMKHVDVEPIIITFDQFKKGTFTGMPVTIEGVSSEDSGIFDGDKTFKYNGEDVNVNVAPQATFFNKPYKYNTESITGIVTTFEGKATLHPRNLEDLENFATSVDLTKYEFRVDGEKIKSFFGSTENTFDITSPYTVNEVTMTFDKGSSENNAQAVTDENSAITTIKIYKGNTITMNSTKAMAMVVMAGAGDAFTADQEAYDAEDAAWIGSSSVIVFTCNKDVELKSIDVAYAQ